MLQKPFSKRVVQKTAEGTGDLIGNKIADETTSVGKSKKKLEFYFFNKLISYCNS